ncbi:unnamed protein product [Adineta steineri]|uniref:Uncharacterized protein n=1 Tax=Adineta steineri TaxID=433720 RepID=A0A814GHK7_9BILA|nr:unnamed protein product [Adineta steineri]
MQRTELIIVFLLHSFILIIGKECIISEDDSKTLICSDNQYITSNLTYYLSTFSNITQLSIMHSYLTAMPDLYNNNQVITLHLDNNHIELITENYSSIEYLYLTSNHIYTLHQTNLHYPKLKLLDLSYNPIEHIIQNFFTEQQFPQLKILKLTNALKYINPYILDNRLISFSPLKYLNEIYFDENDLEEFSCSKTPTYIQWNLPINLKKFSLAKNKLISFDTNCFLQISNITELDLHSNLLKNFSNSTLTLPHLSKLRLDHNLFTNIPSNLLYLSQELNELDLSANPLKLKDIKPRKQYVFPPSLKILYLNLTISDLSCLLFENLIELEQLHLVNLTTTKLKNCIFKKLTKLKTLNLSNHHLKTIDEQVFRPLLSRKQLDKLDITSHFLYCNSCSLRWLNEFLKSQNTTQVNCLDQQNKQILLNTLDVSSCRSSYGIFITTVLVLFSTVFLLCIILLFYTCKHRKLRFSNFQPVYHMVPLQHYEDRIYQNTTEDMTNDNVMLVT